MQIREKPNDAVSPDFRPGLFEEQAHARPGGRGKHQRAEARQEKIAGRDVFREHSRPGDPRVTAVPEGAILRANRVESATKSCAGG